MVNNKKIVVVLPAYNAEKTLEKTIREIPMNIVDELILVDDNSTDQTYNLAKNLGITHIIKHQSNLGYGGNQKSCYKKALELEADIIIMIHPDYQYTPLLIEAMIYPITNGIYDFMLGSRILGKGAIKGGMPVYKYIANRVLTLIQNLLLNQKLSEYHTGYRAFKSSILKEINYTNNSNDFIFDNEFLAQVFHKKFTIGEVSCPTKYFSEASSINLKRSIKYGLGVLEVSFKYRLHKMKIINLDLFK
jgi:glycosyltransferase involved in cell wall biosynthesis